MSAETQERSWSYPYSEPWDHGPWENENITNPWKPEDWQPKDGESWFDAGYRWYDAVSFDIEEDYDVWQEWRQENEDDDDEED